MTPDSDSDSDGIVKDKPDMEKNPDKYGQTGITSESDSDSEQGKMDDSSSDSADDVTERKRREKDLDRREESLRRREENFRRREEG